MSNRCFQLRYPLLSPVNSEKKEEEEERKFNTRIHCHIQRYIRKTNPYIALYFTQARMQMMKPKQDLDKEAKC